MLHRNKSHCHEGQLSNSGTLSESACVSIHMYCILSPSNKYFTQLYHILSLWKFFSAKLKGQDPCHWPLVEWLVSGWDPRPCSKLLQAEVTQDHYERLWWGIWIWVFPMFLKMGRTNIYIVCGLLFWSSQKGYPGEGKKKRPEITTQRN